MPSEYLLIVSDNLLFIVGFILWVGVHYIPLRVLYLELRVFEQFRPAWAVFGTIVALAVLAIDVRLLASYLQSIGY